MSYGHNRNACVCDAASWQYTRRMRFSCQLMATEHVHKSEVHDSFPKPIFDRIVMSLWKFNAGTAGANDGSGIAIIACFLRFVYICKYGLRLYNYCF